jgi:hypothetical protein
LDSRLFGGGDGRLRPSPYLADTPFVVDRPPTHFFVKKKFIPTGGAETATQKVPSVFCCAHAFCGTGSTTHAGGSFFLYEKSILRESDYLRGREPEVSTDWIPPLFSALKKPFKNYGFQGDLDPRCAASGASRRLEAEPRGLALRPQTRLCGLMGAQRLKSQL